MTAKLSRRAFLPAVAAVVAAPTLISLWPGRRARAATPRDEALRQWSKSGYSYCDAQVLAHFWRQPVDDAKVRAGRLIAERKWDQLKSFQQQGRKAALPQAARVCPYHESGFAYADMKTLAGFWDTKIEDTKVKVSKQLVLGDQWSVKKALKTASRKSRKAPSAPLERKR